MRQAKQIDHSAHRFLEHLGYIIDTDWSGVLERNAWLLPGNNVLYDTATISNRERASVIKSVWTEIPLGSGLDGKEVLVAFHKYTITVPSSRPSHHPYLTYKVCTNVSAIALLY